MKVKSIKRHIDDFRKMSQPNQAGQMVTITELGEIRVFGPDKDNKFWKSPTFKVDRNAPCRSGSGLDE